MVEFGQWQGDITLLLMSKNHLTTIDKLLSNLRCCQTSKVWCCRWKEFGKKKTIQYNPYSSVHSWRGLSKIATPNFSPLGLSPCGFVNKKKVKEQHSTTPLLYAHSTSTSCKMCPDTVHNCNRGTHRAPKFLIMLCIYTYSKCNPALRMCIHKEQTLHVCCCWVSQCDQTHFRAALVCAFLGKIPATIEYDTLRQDMEGLLKITRHWTHYKQPCNIM